MSGFSKYFSGALGASLEKVAPEPTQADVKAFGGAEIAGADKNDLHRHIVRTEGLATGDWLEGERFEMTHPLAPDLDDPLDHAGGHSHSFYGVADPRVAAERLVGELKAAGVQVFGGYDEAEGEHKAGKPYAVYEPGVAAALDGQETAPSAGGAFSARYELSLPSHRVAVTSSPEDHDFHEFNFVDREHLRRLGKFGGAINSMGGAQ